jgi:hypothetical protein
MALFLTGEDRKLPLLTQLYQVDVPSGWESDPSVLIESEMETWLDIQAANSLGHSLEDYQAEHKYIGGVTPESLARQSGNLVPFAELHQRTRSIFNEIADFQRVKTEDLFYLNRKAKECTTVEVWSCYLDIDDTHPYGPVVDDGQTSFEPVISVVDLVYQDDDMTGFREFILELMRAVTGEKQTARCEECKSVYLLQRKDQIFCSLRCGSRVTTRRYREKQKAVTRTDGFKEATATQKLGTGVIMEEIKK